MGPLLVGYILITPATPTRGQSDFGVLVNLLEVSCFDGALLSLHIIPPCLSTPIAHSDQPVFRFSPSRITVSISFVVRIYGVLNETFGAKHQCVARCNPFDTILLYKE